MKHRFTVIATILLVAAGPVLGEDGAKALSGTYALGAATLIDPPADEPGNSHLRLYLTGSAARDLYAALPTPAVRDACLDDGSMTKAVGGTSCTRMQGSEDYECSLGIDLAAQRVVSASTC